MAFIHLFILKWIAVNTLLLKMEKKILSQSKETYIMLHILTDLYMSIMETVLITDTMSI